AFNYPDHEVYWKEGTVDYCYSFLTRSLGIEGKLITFKEKPWTGGGNGGNAFEVFVRGLEVATLVFMDLKEDPNGDVSIEGTRYSKMPMRIVDTGYGLERLTWLSQGTPTVYQAVFPEVVEFINSRSHAGNPDPRLLRAISEVAASIEPFSESKLISAVTQKLGSVSPDHVRKAFEFYKRVFALADHSKTIAILLSNHAIPSNVRVGYLLRLLLRRSFFYIGSLEANVSLFDLVKMHHRIISDILPPLDLDFCEKMIDRELKRYNDLMNTGKAAVIRLIDKKKGINTEDLVELYDSHGLNPEFVAEVARSERGISIEVPDDFDALVVSRHSQVKKEERKSTDLPDLFTRPLYYDDPSIREFNALVLYSRENIIVPNQTAFYPEGGGQPSDTGSIVAGGKAFKMMRAEKQGNAIIHYIDGHIPEHTRIHGKVDSFVRDRHTLHHSATHLLLGTLIRVLGEHVWQTGVQKGIETSRIDITHYDHISDETIELIEKECLKAIREGHIIRVRNLEWNRALDTYGFRLFQGGVPEGNRIRVVEIEGIDAEGCGGTHLTNTSQIGFIKIIKTESIQEGIQRITFCAGDAALDYVQKLYRNERKVEQIVTASAENLTDVVERLYRDNLEMKKERSKLEKEQVGELLRTSLRVSGKKGSAMIVDLKDKAELLNMAMKAIMSQGIELGTVVLKEAESIRINVVSSGRIAADEVLRELPMEGYKSTVSGTARFASALVDRKAETLINEHLPKLLQQVLNA
ncbi:MAG: alanine--tRNA ligase, partial [Thermoplasmataceae archaeon]